jgi:3-methyladenine DNA glycosylase AlkD
MNRPRRVSRAAEASTVRVDRVRREVRALSDPERARNLQRFFKTGPGEYGEGDRFLGLTVPMIRSVAKRFEMLPLDGVRTLLASRYHEERLLALLLLVRQYERGDDSRRAEVFRLYMENLRYVNNWDLVDLSAPGIVGRQLRTGDRSLLDGLARSPVLWERRIAVLATFDWIRDGDIKDALRIAGLLVSDQADLIHKAVGWMLRELGKRDLEAERRFLRKYAHVMPRTMLRYAIERFPEAERKQWLKAKRARV